MKVCIFYTRQEIELNYLQGNTQTVGIAGGMKYELPPNIRPKSGM